MPKKLTNEGFIEKLRNKNPNIEALEEYVDAETKIRFKCKLDGYEWFARPASLLHNGKCPKCSKHTIMGKDEYLYQLNIISKDIIMIGEYINASTKILHCCKKCGNQWVIAPTRMVNERRGCPSCNHKRAGQNKKKLHEQYVEEVHLVNENIRVVGLYDGIHKKIEHECLVCGNVWCVDPNSVLHGYGCPECSKTKKTMPEIDYVERLNAINPNIILLGKYVNAMTKVRHRCLIHDYEWDVRPRQLLKGSLCPVCSREARTKAHSVFVQELNIQNPTLEPLTEYENNKIKMLFKCTVCEEEFWARPSSILSGGGCPICKQSHGEKAVALYMQTHNITAIPQYRFAECRNVFCLPFDFYLPDYNACIEYQGEQHYKPVDYFGGQEDFEKRKMRDQIKYQFCKDNNIALVRIKYNQDIDSVLGEFFNNINNT